VAVLGENDAMRALIVDHEPYGREALRYLCEADESINEVAVAECGATAIKMIRARRPDLLLLDVELSDMNGFDVLRSLTIAGRPQVIVVTAREEQVSEALRFGAIDCLIKPISADRFASAIERVRETRNAEFKVICDHSPTTNQDLNSTHNIRRRSPTHLIAENGERLYFIALNDVDYIHASGNYVRIHVGDQKYFRRDTVKQLASELRDQGFECICRSTLVNLARVAFAEKLGHGALAFTLTSGVRLVSKNWIRLSLMHGRRLAVNACE
jgi:two-component system, LytTR family, response regulator